MILDPPARERNARTRPLRPRRPRPNHGAGGRIRSPGALLLLLVGLSALPRTARGDGAFPDSMQLYLPADRPHRLVLGANFGLVLSDDDGASWRWVCEAAILRFAQQYQLGAPPNDTLYAVSVIGLSASRDGACTWEQASGADGYSDVFPDPTDPSHVLAIGTLRGDGGQPASVALESTDGGGSFHALWTPPAGYVLAGIEVSRAATHPIYLTLYGYDAQQHLLPRVAVSIDGGQSFILAPSSAALGNGYPGLAAADPEDASTLYLRLTDSGGDHLAISNDAGATFRLALDVPAMTAFLRRADGSLMVATAAGELYRSTDAGQSFDKRPSTLHVRALAERAGRLYAAASDVQDGFAVGVSDDDGATWTPLLRFHELCGLLDCPGLGSTCAAPEAALVAQLGIVPGPTCSADAGVAPPAGDLGVATDGGANGGGNPDFSSTPDGGGGSGQGCGCSLGGAAHPGAGALVLGAMVLALALGRRRKRARQA